VLQGFGCGAIVPIGMAILLDTYPKERHGRTLATWGMASMVGPALGPTLGGYVITSLSWHWVFLINVPIGIGATYFASRVIPDFPRAAIGALDVLGLLFVTIGLSVTVLGLSEANRWGWSNPVTVTCITVGPLVLAMFAWHVLHTANPIFDIRVFRTRSFSLAMVITGSYFVGQTSRLVFLPLSLQTLRGMTALGVGVLFLPAVTAQIGAFFIAGRLVDRLGRRMPVMIGSMLCVFGLVGMARLSVSTSLVIVCVCVGLLRWAARCAPPPPWWRSPTCPANACLTPRRRAH
jgi:EmrB/QacA subfamily drug resistance transporter